MWRRYWTLFALLWAVSAVQGLTWIYEPVAAPVTDGGTLYIGKVGKNHQIRLIMDARSPSRIIEVDADVAVDVNAVGDRIYVTFPAPSTPGSHHITLTLKKEAGIETFSVGFDVVEGALQIETEGNYLEIPELGEKALSFVVVNPLSSSTYLLVASPFSPPRRIFVPRHEVVGPEEITLRAGFSGLHRFTLTFRDLYSGEEYRIPVAVFVTPTMEGRVESVRIGPDLFFPILYPVRLLLGAFLWLKT